MVVMAIHEPCDIFLAISKQFYYRSKNKLLINGVFTIFAVSWIYLRLFVLAWILHQTWHNPLFMLYDHMRYGSSLLHLMWMMHLIWFAKIVRVLHKGWTGKVVPDVRHDGFKKKEVNLVNMRKED